MIAKIILFLITTLIYVSSNNKCISSSMIKYDLSHLDTTQGYYSVCSEHAPRTCCSRDNFEALSKKFYII